MTFDNVLPFPKTAQSQEIEAKILGAVLDLDEQHSLIEAMGLQSGDFTDARCSIAFGIAGRLAERRQEVNALTVCSTGKRFKMLGDEHLEWLAGLEAANALSKATALQLAGDLRAQARGRSVLSDLKREVELIERGRFNAARVAGALEGIAGALVRDFAPDETADSDLMQILATWDAHAASGTSALLPTGIKVIDDLIGGFPPTLSFIAGEPGRGKTALLGSIIQAQLMNGALNPEDKIGLFGLEDGTSWLSQRWLAKGTGMSLKEVGWKAPTPEQVALRDATSEAVFPLLQRVVAYKGDTITTDQMVHRASHWVFQHKVKCIYLDHLGEVDHRDPRRREEHWQQVAETVRRMRNFATRYAVPVVMLVHTTDDGVNARGVEGPPKANAMAGGRSIDRKARLIIGLWNKKSALRGTILKSTHTDATNTTIEFERIFHAGLVTPDGGRVVNLDAEAAAERKEKKENALEESVANADAKAELRKRRKAKEEPAAPAKPTEPPPQQTLIEVPPTTKPEKSE